MTVLLPVLCPECHTSDIIRHGKSQSGKQRYLCQNPDCLRRNERPEHSTARTTAGS